MKKLMIIAAAMTIASGAYAAGCTPDDVELECSLVYKVKMSLKASRPNTSKAKPNKGQCDPLCYRTPTKITLDGYAIACDVCDCESFQDALTWTLWSNKEKAMYMEDGLVEWDFLNVIGKSATELEGAFSISTYAFAGYAAGFGKLDKKTCTPTSLSGEIAGWGGVPGCGSGGTVCVPTDDFVCTWAYACADYCGDDQVVENIEELPTAYTGKWSLKYSKSEAKKYTAAKWSPKIPAYADFDACTDPVNDNANGEPGTGGEG